jgi:LytS/YehU family sensor histidine kinase
MLLKLIIFLLIIALLAMIVYAWMIHLKWKEEKRLTQALKSQNLELNTLVHSSELKSLRYKLNPHLFKNALNSIQSHAYQTYYSMDKLSGVLDYILYDSDHPLVSLKEEMDFASNFIEINRLKLSPLFDLRIKNQISEEQLENTNFKLLPLITVDLIENAFKHTDFQNSNSFIAIQFSCIDQTFQLEVSNRISTSSPLKKDRSGLGISNLKSRLEIAYPNQYQLESTVENNVYHASLKIALS